MSVRRLLAALSLLAAGTGTTVAQDSGVYSLVGWATAMSAGPADESGQTLTFDEVNSNNPLFSLQPKVDETISVQRDGAEIDAIAGDKRAQPLVVELAVVHAGRGGESEHTEREQHRKGALAGHSVPPETRIRARCVRFLHADVCLFPRGTRVR